MKIISIDKGIPIPKITRGRKPTHGFPFEGMSIGDSFFVPGTDERDRRKLASAASNLNKRGDCGRYSVTKEEGGYRCWRVA